MCNLLANSDTFAIYLEQVTLGSMEIQLKELLATQPKSASVLAICVRGSKLVKL